MTEVGTGPTMAPRYAGGRAQRAAPLRLGLYLPQSDYGAGATGVWRGVDCGFRRNDGWALVTDGANDGWVLFSCQ